MKYLIELQQCKHIYKIKLNKILHNKQKCNTKLIANNEILDYDTQGNSNIHIETVRTNKVLHNPLTQALLKLNQLLQEIRMEQSHSIFIKVVKLYLKTKYIV